MSRSPNSYTSEQLEELNLVNTNPRVIKRTDKVDIKCTKCGAIGEQILWSVIQGKLKNLGFSWQCRDCFRAGQSERAKTRTGECNPFFGRKHSEETKKKMVENHAEWYDSAEGIEWRNRTSESHRELWLTDANPMRTEEGRANQMAATTTPEFIESHRQITVDHYETDLGKKHKETMSRIATERLQDPVYAAWINGKLRGNEPKRLGNFLAMMKSPRGDLVRQLKRDLAAALTPEEKSQINDKRVATFQAHFGADHPMKNKNFRSKFAHNLKQAGCVKRLKKALQERGFDVHEEEQLGQEAKLWDLIIYKDGLPDLAIDIDGEFFHGYESDSYTNKQKSYAIDNSRISKTPEGVKILLVDSRSIHAAMESIVSVLQEDFNTWREKMFQSCLDSPFPYPEYSDKRMLKDWNNLCKMNKYTTYFRAASSIMVNFHPSVYHAWVGRCPSPVEAWSNPVLLRKCINNRFIYKDVGKLTSYHIARGFEINKIAPRVSMFNPVLARYLLVTYAPGAKTVMDPYSGYSGRMIGACSLGCRYLGYDINSTTVLESNKIISFLGLDATVEVVEPGWLPEVKCDALITCPPYGDKEVWGQGESYKSSIEYVKECLEKIDAEVFIFVTDEMWEGKYTEILKNNSLFGDSKEYALVFDSNGVLFGPRNGMKSS